LAVPDVPDMPEAVPLASFLRVVVVERIVVAEKTEFLEAYDRVARRAAIEKRRARVIDRRVETEHAAPSHEASRVDDAACGQEVQASELVRVAEDAPVRFGRSVVADGKVGETRKLVEVDVFHGRRRWHVQPSPQSAAGFALIVR